MAQRRMFSARITESARFLKMPSSTQALYFHLGLHADDDGIVEAYSVMMAMSATEDDLRILVAKGFVTVLNEDLVTYINDWTENNHIRADRKIDSIYQDLLIKILPDVKIRQAKARADTGKKTGNKSQSNKLLESKSNIGRPLDNHWTSNGRHRLGKVRLGKSSIDTLSLTPSHEKMKDPFDQESDNQEEREEKVKGFIENLLTGTRLTITDTQYKQILQSMMQHNLNDVMNIVDETIDYAQHSQIKSLAGYVLTQLKNVGEANGEARKTQY